MNDSIRVLLIEDNPGDTGLIRELLSEEKGGSFRLECADHLSAGMEHLASGKVDVVLLDLELPDSQGFDTFIKAHNSAPQIPIVILSCVTDEELAARVVREGAQSYLLKGRVDSNLLALSLRYAIECKQVEENLKHAAEEWRTTFDSIPDFIAIINKDFRIVRLNKACADLLKAKPWELIGRRCYELFHNSDAPPQHCPYLKVLEKRAPATVKYFEPHLGINLELSASLVFNSKGEIVGMLEVVKDITERKRAEEALKKSEQNYRELAESISDVFFALNKELRCIYWNKASEKITGVSAKDALGRNIYDLFPDMEVTRKAEREEIYLKAIRTKQSQQLVNEYQFGGKDFVIEITAYPSQEDGISVFVKDITERMKTEEALRESEQKYRTLIENVPLRIFYKDKNSVYISCNDNYARDLKIESEEITGRTDDEFYPRGLAEKYRADDRRVIDSGNSERIEEQYVAGGKKMLVETFKTPVKDEKDEVVGVFGVLQDITERKRAEEALRVSEEKYRLVVENAHESIVVIQDEVVKFFNPKALSLGQLTGFSAEEFASKSFIEFVHPDDWEIAMERYLMSLEDKLLTTDYPLRVIDKGGNVRWIEVNAVLITWEGSPAILAFLNDITERKQAEEELRKSEAKYRTLVENIPQKIFLKDVNSIYLSCNQYYAEDLGIEADEIAGKTDYYFYPKELAEKYRTDDRRVIQSEKTEEIEEEYLQHGQKRLIHTTKTPVRDEKGKVVAILGIFSDITERKKMEEEIRDSELMYHTIIQLSGQMGEAIIILQNTEHDKDVQTFVSNEWLRITGYSQEELLGKPFFDLISPRDRAGSVEYHRRKMFGEPISDLYEMSVVRKNGTEIPIEVRSAYAMYKGKVANIVHLRDITERKRMQEQLIMQDRLASIGQLVSGVAHELNNPLTSIIGLSDLLLQREVPDDIKQELKIISDEAQRTVKIVKNLLTFARKQLQEKQPLSINEGIQRVLELRAYEHQVNNIQVNAHFHPDLPEVMGNSSQLQQVFFNIIINAEFFMLEAHGRGTLTISTEKAGNFARASFADDGPGIPRENMKHLFNPFFTTKEVGKGTGLGLSICLGIITEHGGRIWAESMPGKGATFVVELPISQQ